MDASSFFGTSSIAAILGAGCGSFFRTRRTRAFIAAAGAVLAVVPFFPERTSLVEYVFALWDAPAIPTLFFALSWCVFRRRSADSVVNVAETANGKKRLSLKFWRGALILLGALLYASETNFFEFDVYRLGYSSRVGWATALVVLLTSGKTASALATLAVVATSCGIYANFFDSILDFGLWCALTVSFLIERILAGVRSKKFSDARS